MKYQQAWQPWAEYMIYVGSFLYAAVFYWDLHSADQRECKDLGVGKSELTKGHSLFWQQGKKGEMQRLETGGQVLPTIRRDILCSERVGKGDL